MRQLLPLLLLVGVMYLVAIRPQQQRVKAQRALVSALAVGDEIVTVGGLLGRIVRLTDDDVEVETTPGTLLRFRRAAISSRIPADADADADAEAQGGGDDSR